MGGKETKLRWGDRLGKSAGHDVGKVPNSFTGVRVLGIKRPLFSFRLEFSGGRLPPPSREGGGRTGQEFRGVFVVSQRKSYFVFRKRPRKDEKLIETII